MLFCLSRLAQWAGTYMAPGHNQKLQENHFPGSSSVPTYLKWQWKPWINSQSSVQKWRTFDIFCSFPKSEQCQYMKWLM